MKTPEHTIIEAVARSIRRRLGIKTLILGKRRIKRASKSRAKRV